MSKPNLLGFSSSVGIYRNKRLRDLEEILSKQIPRKVPFADMAPMTFQVVMAYAAENQIDGDFSDYTSKDFAGIFATNHITVSLSEAAAIRKAFDAVGLMENGKIRSWAKFNRHFAEHEKIVKAKRRAGKLSREKWLKGLKQQPVDPSKNGGEEREKPAPKSVQKAPQKDSDSKRLWVLDQALLQARGKARKELLRQREELLSESTGVDLTQPSPSPAPPPPTPERKLSAKELERDLLGMAKDTLERLPDALSEQMVTRLVRAGQQLPDQVRVRFSKLLAKLEAKNPVPE